VIKGKTFDGVGDLFQGQVDKKMCWDLCISQCGCVAASYQTGGWFGKGTCWVQSGRPHERKSLRDWKWPNDGETLIITGRRSTRIHKEFTQLGAKAALESTNDPHVHAAFTAPICEWTKPEPDRVTKDGWFYVSSPVSTSGDDDEAVAECPIGYVLTGCQCRDEDPFADQTSCDGAIMKHGPLYNWLKSEDGQGFPHKFACYAYANGKTKKGVYADAVCAPDDGACTDYGMGMCKGWRVSSAPDFSSRSTAKCNDDEMITGCTCHSWWNGCKSHHIEGGACVAEGENVQAHARCGPRFPGERTVVTNSKPELGFTHGMMVKAVCPTGTRITDCWCSSKYGNCGGAEAFPAAALGMGQSEREQACIVVARSDKLTNFKPQANAICVQNADGEKQAEIGAGYREEPTNGPCVSANGQSIPNKLKINQPYATNQAECAVACDAIPGCTAYEWVEAVPSVCRSVIGGAKADTRLENTKCVVKTNQRRRSERLQANL